MSFGGILQLVLHSLEFDLRREEEYNTQQPSRITFREEWNLVKERMTSLHKLVVSNLARQHFFTKWTKSISNSFTILNNLASCLHRRERCLQFLHYIQGYTTKYTPQVFIPFGYRITGFEDLQNIRSCIVTRQRLPDLLIPLQVNQDLVCTVLLHFCLSYPAADKEYYLPRQCLEALSSCIEKQVRFMKDFLLPLKNLQIVEIDEDVGNDVKLIRRFVKQIITEKLKNTECPITMEPISCNYITCRTCNYSFNATGEVVAHIRQTTKCPICRSHLECISPYWICPLIKYGHDNL